LIDTGIKYFGQKIFIESTGNNMVDEALKTVFHDDFYRTAPLEMRRIDAQIVLRWSRGEIVGED